MVYGVRTAQMDLKCINCGNLSHFPAYRKDLGWENLHNGNKFVLKTAFNQAKVGLECSLY